MTGPVELEHEGVLDALEIVAACLAIDKVSL